MCVCVCHHLIWFWELLLFVMISEIVLNANSLHTTLSSLGWYTSISMGMTLLNILKPFLINRYHKIFKRYLILKGIPPKPDKFFVFIFFFFFFFGFACTEIQTVWASDSDPMMICTCLKKQGVCFDSSVALAGDRNVEKSDESNIPRKSIQILGQIAQYAFNRSQSNQNIPN